MNKIDIMAIAARRDQLERDLRAEGATEQTIQELATDVVAARMVEHEHLLIERINSLFGRRHR